MNDFNRIRQNVELMASHNAPEKDIDGYLATEGLTPDKFKSQMSQVPSDPGRLESAAKYSAGSGVSNLIDSVPRAVVGAGNLVRMGTGYLGNKLGLLSADQMPEPMDPNMLDIANPAMRQAGLINDNYAPTDKAGRVLDTTVQTLTGGGINPSAIIRNGAQGLIKPVVRDIVAPTLSGTAMGVANVATDGLDTGNESLNTALKTGAALAAGSVAGAPVAMRGTAGDRAAAALKSVSPEQLALAKALQQKAAANGSPITGYEAIQAVTGLNPKMQTQQRLAEQSDAAGGGLTTMMQNRPANNATLFAKTADTIAPVPSSPDATAGLLKKAASDAINTATKARSEAVYPLYQGQRSSDAEAMNLLEQIPNFASDVANRTAERARAIQIGGQLSGLKNDMTQTAKIYSPVPGYPSFPARYLPHTDVAEQAGFGVLDAQANAAEKAAQIATAQQKLNAASDALAEKNLPEITSKVQSMINNLDQQIKVAGPTVEGQHLQALRNELAPQGNPIVYPSQLESVYRNNRNKLDIGPFSTSEERTQAGILGPQVSSLDALIKDVSPSIAQGRQLYADLSKQTVEPLQLGQVGKLARSDDFGTQAGVLLPEVPMDVNPSVVSKTMSTIGAEDPTIGPTFLAQYLRGTFNEANQKNVAGDNVFGGAKFAAKVAGNPIQEGNLTQAISSSGVDPQALADALEIYRAQGMKPPVNSATFANASEGKSLLSHVNPLPWLASKGEHWANGWATSDLARALIDPNSIDELTGLARINGSYSPLKQNALANLLISQQPQ